MDSFLVAVMVAMVLWCRVTYPTSRFLWTGFEIAEERWIKLNFKNNIVYEYYMKKYSETFNLLYVVLCRFM